MNRRRDVQRNSAFFLGAFGTTLGVLGGSMSFVVVLIGVFPSFGTSAPDWFFALVVILMLVAIIGAWPVLDWLDNNRPGVGGPVMAVTGTCMIALGLAAAMLTEWGLVGWLSVAGGAIMLPAAQLAITGGGTEPLTWRSLRTERMRRVEVRADLAVSAATVVVSIGSLIVLVAVAFADGDLLTLVGLACVGTGTLGWLIWRWFRA